MHEMAYTRAALDMVLGEAQKVGSPRVRKVSITVGIMRDIVGEQFKGMFLWLARGTVVQDAEVELVRAPFAARCSACQTLFWPDYYRRETWVCPECGSRSLTVESGKQFSINYIEMEPSPAVEPVSKEGLLVG